MKRRLAKSWKRIVATTLIMAMILTSTSLESLAAETDGNSPPVKTEKEETAEKEEVVCKENVIESKNTEDSTTYDAGDGVLVTEYYGQDVRFRNEDGELVDYDPTLKKLESRDDLNGYAYENTAGDQKQYFPENLTEETPILLENEDKQIRLVPVEGPEKNDKKGDSLKEQIDLMKHQRKNNSYKKIRYRWKLYRLSRQRLKKILSRMYMKRLQRNR